MRTSLIIAVAFASLTACGSTETQRAAGVGFSDYAQFEIERARREAALSAPRQSIVPQPQVNSIPGAPGQQTGGAIAASELAAAGIGQNQPVTLPPQTAPAGAPGRTGGLDAAPGNPAPALANNASGISDEQSFDAVSNRETIESDAERRAAQAAARQEIQPTAVPQRPSSTGPNIVEYAINAPNVKGQEWYSRSLLSGQGRFQRNCAQYASADEAQRAFLARGGPERDRLGIDPDGDGFACGWDPAPFKQAAGN
ncbi:hypothetical protein [Yoonia sp. 2307UL14-13]|uniref:hypothetical protein n=1 Tax=Yoonia sp. 2307UL14-13 TaxID=3126506 RepID=UPI0030B74FBA